jgi:hypothetical protein
MERQLLHLQSRHTALRRPPRKPSPSEGGPCSILAMPEPSLHPPAPPTWPAPPVMFPQFVRLPAEIRLLVWELYLAASRRIHVVHETGPPPSTRIPGRDEAIPYRVTTLDAATNAPAPGLRSAFVNHECREIARRLRLLDTHDHSGIYDRTAAVWLAHDIQKSSLGRRGGTVGNQAAIGTAQGQSNHHHYQQHQHHYHHQQQRQDPTLPVYVDWANDLIFICSPSNEQAFRNLAEAPWASRIQRLAVLVPRRCETYIPFGPGYTVSHVLRPMTALRDIYVVMIPLARPAPDPHGWPANGWGRDRYGFVDYVDYLKEVRITTKEMSRERHLTYQRTALSLVQALGKHLEMPGVKMRKVVDVDCSLFTESAYARRPRWMGIKPAKAGDYISSEQECDWEQDSGNPRTDSC